MKTTVINTSKEMGAYSDFLPPSEAPNYMHNRELLNYFESYANYYNLNKFIRFNHRVLNIERNLDYETTGKWKINFLDDKQNEKSEIFDGVLLATGHHSVPNIPIPWPGQENFKGKISHSHDYHDFKGFEDKIVVIVGIGNSGGDIAVELSRVARQVHLVTRRGTWLRRRLVDEGFPVDFSGRNRFVETLALKIFPLSYINKKQEKQASKWFNHEIYGLKPKHAILATHPTVNDELPNRLANGTVKIRPNIREFTETGIIFEDGTQVDDVDQVVFSTGYFFDFSLIEKGKLIPVKKNVTDLFMNMYPPQLSNHNSLIILGLIQPLGAIMPISELQSRIFYDVLTKNTKLPDKNSMMKEIKKRRDALHARYVDSPRHTIQVDHMPFLDELADLIGCKPKFFKIFLKDSALAWKILQIPAIACTYRILGPHPWNGAKDAIFGLENRVLAGMSPNGKPIIVKKQKNFPWIKMTILIFGTIFVVKKYESEIVYFVKPQINKFLTF